MINNELQKLVQEAEALCEKREFSKALPIGEKLVSRWPDEMLPYYIRGRARGGTKAYNDALADLDKALEKEPDFAKTWYYRGNVLRDMKRYEEALECYNRALQIDPEYTYALNGKGAVLRDMKRYEEALEYYDRALQIDPEFTYASNNKGNVLRDMKRYEEALESFDRALQIDPNDGDYYYNKGAVLRDMKRYEEALESFDRALQIDPEDTYALNGKGAVLRDMKRYEEALVNYSRAITFEKKGMFYMNRALSHEMLNRYEDALADYNKGLELEPGNASIQFLRKWLIEKHFPDLITENDEAAATEEIVKDEEKWKQPASRAVKRFMDEEDSDGVFPDGETANLDDALIHRIQQCHQDKQQKAIETKVEKNKESFKQFTTDQRLPDNVLNPEFYVLRRWNSYTPIVTHNNGASKGGGYFLHMGTSGVVIDPGFNFIENFQEWGFSFSQIGTVFISHAHNDHDADLESILTLLHVYNKDIKKKIVDDLVNEVLTGDFPEKETAAENDIYLYIKKEKALRYRRDRKVIDLYLTIGAFKKHAAWLELRRDKEYRVHVIKPDEKPIELGKDVSIRPICAKHFDLMSDCDAVGFVIEFPDFALVYTGDTGYSPEIGKKYMKLKEELEDKKHIALLAHIGGFKSREEAATTENLSSGKAFYKDHLGRNGLICLVDILRPQCCIISEFGEEFAGSREGVAELFDKLFEDQKIWFFPADIGLCMNSNMEILAIRKTTMYHPEKVFLETEFMKLPDVRILRLENGSLIYHHSEIAAKKGEVNRLRADIKRVENIGEQLGLKHTPLS